MLANDAELYRLWYEYLRRSKVYKEFCELARHRNDPSVRAKLEEFHTICFINYDYNGDVHELSFEQWYERKKVFREELLKRDESIQVGSEVIRDLAKKCWDYFELSKKAEPTRDELIEDMIRRVSLYRPKSNQIWFGQPILYLRVDVARCDTKELISQFSKIVRKQKKEPWVKIMEKVDRSTHEPTAGLVKRAEDLKRYLRVYDLRQDNKGYKEIIEIMKEEGYEKDSADSLDPDKERAYKRYYQKAKKIIQKTERGSFPEKY